MTQDANVSTAAGTFFNDITCDFSWKVYPTEASNTTLEDQLASDSSWLPAKIVRFLPKRLSNRKKHNRQHLHLKVAQRNNRRLQTSSKELLEVVPENEKPKENYLKSVFFNPF